jgi:hypothetical protein
VLGSRGLQSSGLRLGVLILPSVALLPGATGRDFYLGVGLTAEEFPVVCRWPEPSLL